MDAPFLMFSVPCPSSPICMPAVVHFVFGPCMLTVPLAVGRRPM